MLPLSEYKTLNSKTDIKGPVYLGIIYTRPKPKASSNADDITSSMLPPLCNEQED